MIVFNVTILVSLEVILISLEPMVGILLWNWLLKLIFTEILFKIASKLTSIVTILAGFTVAGEHLFLVLVQYLQVLSRWMHPTCLFQVVELEHWLVLTKVDFSFGCHFSEIYLQTLPKSFHLDEVCDGWKIKYAYQLLVHNVQLDKVYQLTVWEKMYKFVQGLCLHVDRFQLFGCNKHLLSESKLICKTLL